MRTPSSASDLPETLPLFPLAGALLLPRTHRPLNVFEPRFVAMIDDALGSHRLIGLIQPQASDEEAPGGDAPLQAVGCIGRLTHFEEQAEERYLIVLEGLCRFRYRGDAPTDTPYRVARIDVAPYAADFMPGLGAEAVDREALIAMIRDYSEFADFKVDFNEIARTGTEELVNLSAMLTPYGPREKQALLEAETLSDRAETLIALAEMEMARAGPGAILQ